MFLTKHVITKLTSGSNSWNLSLDSKHSILWSIWEVVGSNLDGIQSFYILKSNLFLLIYSLIQNKRSNNQFSFWQIYVSKVSKRIKYFRWDKIRTHELSNCRTSSCKQRRFCDTSCQLCCYKSLFSFPSSKLNCFRTHFPFPLKMHTTTMWWWPFLLLFTLKR